MPRRLRTATVTAAILTAATVAPVTTEAAAATPPTKQSATPTVAYAHLALPNGQWARVYSDGVAEVYRTAPNGTQQTKLVQLPLLNVDGGTAPSGDGPHQLPSGGDLIMDLIRDGGTPYADRQLLVIYRSGVTAPTSLSVPTGRNRPAATPAYTSDARLNGLLSRLGVDRASRVFAPAAAKQLASMRATAQQRVSRPLLDFPDAYLLHLSGENVPAAMAQLRASPDVAYAAPNWTVSTARTPAVPVPSTTTRAMAAPQVAGQSALPNNYTLTSSAQSLLDRPGVDAVPAYTALARYGQLPGQGEIITNVSLGDLTDASAAADPKDPCNFYAANYGPTTIVQDGQRYLDWPSMPLIPTYTSDANGKLDPTGETCGQDPQLTEVGLDFSMMAPLPHDRQRPGAQGSGLTDLLGIAPGASYRLVIPKTPGGAISDVDAAFAAAATQTPRPDVITASLAFGLDAYGFGSRYLEEDPMTESIIASIVHGAGIIVCVAADDGLRTATNAAVPPSGGSVETNVGATPTDINDVAFSSAPSRVPDSGAIDVGGSTLNDIFAAPPGNPRNARLQSQQAFPATRYTGGRLYSSGVGSRVNISAPGDNVLSLQHTFGAPAQGVGVILEGGTSASAPEVAAAAAIVLQTARLLNDRQLPGNPLAVRDFLARTGTPLPAVPQSDLPLNVGPQIDIGNAVATLFAEHGVRLSTGVARVAVAQRQQSSALGGAISTAADPSAIPLTGRLADAWLTIAPDWVGLPRDGVTYRLTAGAPHIRVLATTPWTRLQPAEILAAAGLPLVSATPRTVQLTYLASAPGRPLVRAKISLTFGPTDGTRQSVPAPLVEPVVHGPTLRVRYDIRGLTGATDPILVVSQPGRVESATGLFFRPAYTAALTAPTGTIDVPVSALPGAGIYGVGIQDAPGGWASRNDSAFAFTRVAPTGDAQPAVPLVWAAGQQPGHYAEFPYRGTVSVGFDVRNVPGATDAIIEVSAPGPTPWRNSNPFNNPNGSERDANGHDSGSVAYVPVRGRQGSVTLHGMQLGLDPTMNHVVRVLATRRGQVVGEASGVSTVSMDGVRPADGGSVAGGFGVDGAGGAGLLTSDQTTASGENLGSVEGFDQTTGAITATVASSADSYGTISGGCPGVFHGDVGLYDDYAPATGQDTYRTVQPVAGDGARGTWSPPDALGGVLCVAANQDTDETAVLAGQGGNQPTLAVAATNVGANTFGPAISLQPALDPAASDIAGGIAVDDSTRQAVVPVVDGANPNAPGRIVTADLATGAVAQFPALTTWFAAGVAVDSRTHKAVVPTTDTFGVYDLAQHTGAAYSLGGGSGYQHPAADPTRGVFVLQEVSPPDYFGTSPNNNAMSSIVVVDENGTLLRRIEAFNFFDIYLLDMGSFVQLAPDTGTGFTLGPGGGQLYPFSYAG